MIDSRWDNVFLETNILFGELASNSTLVRVPKPQGLHFPFRSLSLSLNLTQLSSIIPTTKEPSFHFIKLPRKSELVQPINKTPSNVYIQMRFARPKLISAPSRGSYASSTAENCSQKLLEK